MSEVRHWFSCLLSALVASSAVPALGAPMIEIGSGEPYHEVEVSGDLQGCSTDNLVWIRIVSSGAHPTQRVILAHASSEGEVSLLLWDNESDSDRVNPPVEEFLDVREALGVRYGLVGMRVEGGDPNPYSAENQRCVRALYQRSIEKLDEELSGTLTSSRLASYPPAANDGEDSNAREVLACFPPEDSMSTEAEISVTTAE